jgi:hypothetical protein
MVSKGVSLPISQKQLRFASRRDHPMMRVLHPVYSRHIVTVWVMVLRWCQTTSERGMTEVWTKVRKEGLQWLNNITNNRRNSSGSNLSPCEWRPMFLMGSRSLSGRHSDRSQTIISGCLIGICM